MLKIALRIIFLVLVSFAGLIPTLSSAATAQIPQRPVDLSGFWRFSLDRTDSGVNQLWFTRPFREQIRLPGILQSQYQGDEISTGTPWVLSLYDRFWFLRDDYKDYKDRNVKVPFLSQPPRHYVGVAWYQRDIFIPANWAARRIVLTLERPHWETTVWIGGKKIGSDKSLVAPHVYDLGTVGAGRHQLTIRVDNRMLMSYRPDAHSVSDSLAASWNGIVGRIELSATGRVWIDDAQVFPDLSKKSMLIKVRIGNQTGLSGSGTLTAIWPDFGIVPVTWDDRGGVAEVEVPLREDVATWSEFNPRMHSLRLWLRNDSFEEYLDLRIGIRDFRAEGNEFRLNGRHIIFRGTQSGGDFPLTGYPATDVAYWRKIFEICKSWGLNHMRFHSWCPPEAAFEAADSLGFYLQPEAGMWNELGPGTPMEQMLNDETNRMIKAYGNHPSFMLLSPGNEPRGKWKEVLTKWVEHYRKEDPRRLYTSGTGHTEREIPNLTEGTDYLAIHRIGPNLLRRESGWFGRDYSESLVEVNVPVISHQVGQWAAYPDYDVIKKFTGYLRPGNLEIFRDSLKAHGLLEKNKEFARASGRFQLSCYKEEIEANLRTPGLGGFQLADLHDYLGQGTAFVGLLDPFWQSKDYATPEEFKQFCNTTVPLARLRQRVFTTTEPFDVDVEIAHFGAEPIENAKGVWRVGEIHGEWDSRTIQIGKNISLGRLSVALAKLKAPGEYRLNVTVAPESFFSPVTRKIITRPDIVRGVNYFENEWKFWIYPPANTLAQQQASSETSVTGPRIFNNPKSEPERPLNGCPESRVQDVLVTSSWEEAEAKLASGGKVLFSPRASDLDWTSPPLDTIPIFWNRQMIPGWGRNLGLFIETEITKTKNLMLTGFPTSSNFDWQWAQIVSGVRAINLDRLPAELEPVVWAIDDWNRNYKLGVLFECAVGDGRLLVSAIDVTRESQLNPVLRQLRSSLLFYMRHDCFQPNIGISRAELRSLLFDTRIMSKLGASAQSNGESANALIDGDPNTFFLASDQNAPVRDTVEIVVSFRAPVAMAGFVVMPRQNHREHEGDVREYIIQTSDDARLWSEVARGELVSSYAPQRIELLRTTTAKYIKFISLSGFGTDKTTALSELAIIYAGPKLGSNAP